MPDTIRVKILKKIFFSDESGYGVYKTQEKGSKEQPVIVGNLLDIGEGDFLEVTGDYVKHPKFGRQFKVERFEAILPDDRDGMIKYLASREIKGLGPKRAEKIVDHFGAETFDVLREEPERLKEIKGIRKKLIEEVKQNMKDNKIIRELTVKLAPYGIGSGTIFKIYKEFGEDCFHVLEQNAYLLIQKIRGVGFKIADTIALSMGVERNDSHRVRAGVHFLVSQAEQQKGDLYIEESELTQRCAALLDVDPQEVTDNIDSLVERNEAVREELPEPVILSYRNFSLEKSIAQRLYALANPSEPLKPLDVDFNYIYRTTSVKLTEEQGHAVMSALNNRITVITGGPGTGKTTIIRGIIKAFEKKDMNVLVAAPTGRAAKRIEEATHYPASTIHRMLKIDPETGRFVHDESNPLKADAVIVDEFSMVDVFLFYSLLKAISIHTRLVIIGDKDQLPSVGPGNVLRDIIGSGHFDIRYLSRNFRQDEESLIIDNAYRVNSGEPLIFKPYSDDLDFVFVRVTSDAQAQKKVMGILDYYKESYPYNSPDFQVLVPMYRGDAGIDMINDQIQERFNREKIVYQKEKTAYKRSDKVMQLKNNYEKEVFNGEQGIIEKYDAEEQSLFIDFDGRGKEYHVTELDELTLSYAVSVHKSQGSEYDMVVLVLLPSHWIMLNRELFYTAVTRARKRLFLVSDEATVQRAITNAAPSQRKTLLQRRLGEIFV